LQQLILPSILPTESMDTALFSVHIMMVYLIHLDTCLNTADIPSIAQVYMLKLENISTFIWLLYGVTGTFQSRAHQQAILLASEQVQHACIYSV
jgi:uncharacterized protein with PQ loop repeat